MVQVQQLMRGARINKAQIHAVGIAFEAIEGVQSSFDGESISILRDLRAEVEILFQACQDNDEWINTAMGNSRYFSGGGSCGKQFFQILVEFQLLLSRELDSLNLYGVIAPKLEEFANLSLPWQQLTELYLEEPNETFIPFHQLRAFHQQLEMYDLEHLEQEIVQLSVSQHSQSIPTQTALESIRQRMAIRFMNLNKYSSSPSMAHLRHVCLLLDYCPSGLVSENWSLSRSLWKDTVRQAFKIETISELLKEFCDECLPSTFIWRHFEEYNGIGCVFVYMLMIESAIETSKYWDEELGHLWRSFSTLMVREENSLCMLFLLQVHELACNLSNPKPFDLKVTSLVTLSALLVDIESCFNVFSGWKRIYWLGRVRRSLDINQLLFLLLELETKIPLSKLSSTWQSHSRPKWISRFPSPPPSTDVIQCRDLLLCLEHTLDRTCFDSSWDISGGDEEDRFSWRSNVLQCTTVASLVDQISFLESRIVYKAMLEGWETYRYQWGVLLHRCLHSSEVSTMMLDLYSYIKTSNQMEPNFVNGSRALIMQDDRCIPLFVKIASHDLVLAFSRLPLDNVSIFTPLFDSHEPLQMFERVFSLLQSQGFVKKEHLHSPRGLWETIRLLLSAQEYLETNYGTSEEKWKRLWWNRKRQNFALLHSFQCEIEPNHEFLSLLLHFETGLYSSSPLRSGDWIMQRSFWLKASSGDTLDNISGGLLELCHSVPALVHSPVIYECIQKQSSSLSLAGLLRLLLEMDKECPEALKTQEWTEHHPDWIKKCTILLEKCQ